MLDQSGFLINSHDPLRGHVLKHIRQNSLTGLRYSVADEGNEKRKCKFKNFNPSLMPRKRGISFKSLKAPFDKLSKRPVVVLGECPLRDK